MIPLNPQITDAGLSLFPNPNVPGFHVQLTHIALGTAKYTPTGAETTLGAEVVRFPLLPVSGSPGPRQVQIGANITDQDPSGRTANGQWIGEIGFYAGATLFAVWSKPILPLFYKTSAFDVALAYTMDVSRLPVGSVTVAVDIGLASMQSIMFAHEANPNPHPQYRAELAEHVAAANPHPQYKAMVDEHAAASDPHPQYLTPVEANDAYVKQGGGVGQLSNTVKMGWSAPGKLKATVDTTDLGNVAFEAWVTQKIADEHAALVNGAPGALDQLNELAAAMANDPNFATTMLNALAGKERKFDPGTRMLFQQSAAPVGWTKDVSHNDKALRVVSGAAGSGGTLNFSAAFVNGNVGATALTIAQMPGHTHSTPAKARDGSSANLGDGGTTSTFPGIVTGSTGGGETHTHTNNLDIKYVDIIIATKD